MTKFFFILALALAAAAGWYASRLWPGVSGTENSRKIIYYQSPMHPWVKSKKPGHCTVCGMDLVPIYEGGKNFDHTANSIVMLPRGSPHVVGVQLAEVKKRTLTRTLRVAGMIGEDELRHGIISASVDGRVDAILMGCEGQNVVRGQPFATIFSKTLLNAASDYKRALKSGGTELDAPARKLQQYGLTREQIAAISTRQDDDIYFGLTAMLSGTIVKSYVSEGQYVKEGEKLLDVADFTRMIFMFTAYEQDLPFLRAGQIITVTTPSLPGEALKARVGETSVNLDEMTRSVRLRVVLENPGRRLKNRSFAQGVIEIEVPDVLAIPRSAVLWPGKAPRVYIEIEPGSYEQRLVKLGRLGDDGWEVLDGLKAGERVVKTGNMLLDSQAQLDAELHEPTDEKQ